MLASVWLRVAAVLLAMLPILWDRGLFHAPVTLHVAPGGDDTAGGRSADTALRTIQAALDRVGPGDTVVVAPGVYREWLTAHRPGRPGRPVTLRAAEPGTVTVTGRAGLDLGPEAWRDEGGGLWSAAVPWPVHVVRMAGEHLYHLRWHADPPARLRHLAARPGAHGAFAWQEGRLLVARPGDAGPPRDPEVHRAVAPPRVYGSLPAANLSIRADHQVVEGLRLDLGVGASVDVWDADDVVIRDNVLRGADVGVRAIRPVRRLVVERNHYDHAPQGDWTGWLRWAEIYAHHADASLVRVHASDSVVRDNLVLHAGDAIAATSEGGGLAITGNLALFGSDDGLELDGPGHGTTVSGNVIGLFHSSVSAAPLSQGPLAVFDNLFFGAVGRRGTHLKFAVPVTDPDRVDPANRVVRRTHVHDNLLIGKTATYGEGPFETVRVEDNRLVAVHDYELGPRPGLDWRHNEVVDDDRGPCRVAVPAVARLLRTAGPHWRSPAVDRAILTDLEARLRCR